MNRMGANLLFNERVQTRVLQAVGRCTRGLNDYSAVVVTGEDLSAYLTDRKRRRYFHPEFQAELEFGIDQSTGVGAATMLENFEIFLEHDVKWKDANQSILDSRDKANQADFPAMTQLAAAVPHEIGTVHDRSFAGREREIREGLKSGTAFEEAQVLLGEHLGFEAGKKEEDASPDPWWRVGDIVLVFEDHANAGANAMIDATKARQAAWHPDWVRAHVPGTAEAKIQPVLVTPATTAKKGAVPHLGRVGLWSLEEFQNWADAALDTVREILRKFVEPGDLDWRANAAALLERAGADAPSLYERLLARPAGQHLKEVA